MQNVDGRRNILRLYDLFTLGCVRLNRAAILKRKIEKIGW